MGDTSIGSPVQVLRTALEHAGEHGADAAAVAAFVGLSQADAQSLRRDLEQALRALGRGEAADTLVAAGLPHSPHDIGGLMGIAKSLEGVSTSELKTAVSYPHMLARASDQAAVLWGIADAKHSGANGGLGNTQWVAKISELDRQLQRAGLCPEETARAVIAGLHQAFSALGRSPYADGARQIHEAGRVLGPLLNVIELRLADRGSGKRHAIDTYHGDSPHIAFQHLARGWVKEVDATFFFIKRNQTSADQWAPQSATHRAYLTLMDHLATTLEAARAQAPRT